MEQKTHGCKLALAVALVLLLPTLFSACSFDDSDRPYAERRSVQSKAQTMAAMVIEALSWNFPDTVRQRWDRHMPGGRSARREVRYLGTKADAEKVLGQTFSPSWPEHVHGWLVTGTVSAENAFGQTMYYYYEVVLLHNEEEDEWYKGTHSLEQI